jgi:hypothetical protein
LKGSVFDQTRLTVKDHEGCLSPAGGRVLSDQGKGKVVIELFNFHILLSKIELKLNKTNKVYPNLQVEYLTLFGGAFFSHFEAVCEALLPSTHSGA